MAGCRGGGVKGTTYYGEEAYNVLQNLLNPSYDFSKFDFSQYSDITPQLAGLYAHRAMANFFRSDDRYRNIWFPEQAGGMWKLDMNWRSDLQYRNSGVNAVWELKPIGHLIDPKLSLSGKGQVKFYADMETYTQHKKFYVGSSNGAPIPPINGETVTDWSGYRFSYVVPFGSDGMIYYECLNCKSPEKQREPAIDSKTVQNAAIAVGAAYIIYKIAVGVLTWECGGCGALVTP